MVQIDSNADQPRESHEPKQLNGSAPPCVTWQNRMRERNVQPNPERTSNTSRQ